MLRLLAPLLDGFRSRELALEKPMSQWKSVDDPDLELNHYSSYAWCYGEVPKRYKAST
jgi:hypothetical protein